MKKIIYNFAFIFFYLASQQCVAQNNDVIFNLITNNNGELLGKIGAITQDPYGYMWFAGQDAQCFYRFDGYKITTFKNDSLNANLPGGTNIETIYADAGGHIWIGYFGNGLDEFNPATHQFRHFKYSVSDATSLSNDSVNQILKDSKGTIWIATQHGLNKLDEKTGQFIHYFKKQNDTTSLSSDVVRAIYEDHQGTLWIGTGFPFDHAHPEDGGLNRLQSNGTFKQFLHDAGNSRSLLNNKVRSLFEDSRGNFWVGTGENGLHIMDRKSGSFTRYIYDPKHPDNLSGPEYNPQNWFEHITFITEDGSGAIWMGTYKSGINRYDPATKKITHYLAGNGFPDRSGWCAFTSKDGVLWLSTQEPNLFRVDPFHKSITNTFTGDPVNCFYEDTQKLLWIGTDEKGLLEFDENKNLLHQFGDGMIHSILQEQDNTLWLGTGGDVTLFHKSSQSFAPFTIQDETISAIKDKDGFMWFATLGGLIKFNPKNKAVVKYAPDAKDPNAISSLIILSILQDKAGFIWAGAYPGGINRLDITTGKFSHYLTSLAGLCIYESNEGTIWVGTSKGLYTYNQSTNSFSAFFDAQSGIGTERVNNIIEDNYKNLWISTALNVVKINSTNNEISVYGKKYGITPNTLRTGIYKTSKGEILIGNNKGFYTIVPDEFPVKTETTKILLTGFYVNDSMIVNGEKNILLKPIEDADKIELKYNQNHLTFSFTLTDYRSPEDNKIYTRLDGFDSTWRISGTNKTTDYFNVPPGTYLFRVKAFSSEGTSSEKTLSVIVNPPWWKTWWAYILYAVCFLVISFFVNRLIRKRIKEKQEIKSRKIELEHAKDIEKAYNQLKSTQAQLIQSEKMASLGELTAGIAHEIQNPLNFVNNFSEINDELIKELKNEVVNGNFDAVNTIADDIESNSEKINYHGKRADAIVKGMLQHSRSSTGAKEQADINELADEYLRLAFHGMRARDKNFNAAIKTDFDKSIGKTDMIPQDIGRVLLNLYNNAFYATNEKKRKAAENYEPTVTVSTSSISSPLDGRAVTIKISDNGGGIPQNIIDKIFQPFFTTKPTGQGTGLGLSLSYDIIKAHGGDIKVESTEEAGTIFIIRLPNHSS